jgi:hypothetical protein
MTAGQACRQYLKILKEGQPTNFEQPYPYYQHTLTLLTMYKRIDPNLRAIVIVASVGIAIGIAFIIYALLKLHKLG